MMKRVISLFLLVLCLCCFVATSAFAEGNLISVDYDTLYNVAVHPGSTITQKLILDGSILEYMEENQLTPGSVDAIVCYELE